MTDINKHRSRRARVVARRIVRLVERAAAAGVPTSGGATEQLIALELRRYSLNEISRFIDRTFADTLPGVKPAGRRS